MLQACSIIKLSLEVELRAEFRRQIMKFMYGSRRRILNTVMGG